MSESDQETSSHEAYNRFLSHSPTSEDKFASEYKKFYYGKPKSKEFYLFVLTELKNAVIAGNIGNFKRFAKVLDYITNIESQATLKTYFDDTENPIISTNLVIFACKHNKFEILKHILGNRKVLENLSVNVGKEAITPDCKDESCHDAFYYAVLSGNVELIDTLIDKWPGNYFNSRSKELDEVLSIAYEELKLKNVSLSESVEVFVENKLINLRFFSNNSANVQISVSDQINNIKERVDLVLEKISFLKSEYSDVEKLDGKFLFVARFIAQNIHVLKRQLRISYDKLPWEEMEFCLISFISSYLIQQDINLFYRTILNKNKILRYLANFAKKLETEKHIIERVDIDRLSDLPKQNRDLVVEEIIRHNPEFEDLYNDYQQIRDIHSLEKISEYLNLALSTNPKEREGQLIITRALQVIGEYLKNTLESPKLSNTTSDLLLMSLPKNTRRIIIDLRNSLSHANSLTKRTEIEENNDADFFIGVQNDTKRIDNVIIDILYNNKMKMIRILLQRIASSESLQEMEKIARVLKNVELDKMASAKFNMMEHEKLEKLISDMNDAITDKTGYEIELFNKISVLITSVKSKSQNVRTDYKLRFSLLKGFLSDFYIDGCDIEIIKSSAVNTLVCMFGQKVESNNLEEIPDLALKIADSAKSRLQGDSHDIVMRSACETFYNTEFDKNDIKWIEKLREKLFDKGSFIPSSKQKTCYDMTEDEYKKQLASKLSELKNILKNDLTSGKLIENLPSYRKNKQLQAAVEMLVLDIMSILGASENHLENNLLFLDDNSPLLTGKCLRNHLAHGNSLLDVLLSDPSIAVILNAQKLISKNIVKSKKKVGKSVRDDPSLLRDKFDQCLATIANQEEMFSALDEGNLEKLNICLGKGADINARSINSWSALHFASRGPSLEVVKFTFDRNLNTNVADVNGQSPLHIAAAHGRKDTVEFFIAKAQIPVDIADRDGKTALHLAARNGHKHAVEILLKCNANTNAAADEAGYRPLHYAIQFNHVDVAKILLEKEANVDANETKGGCTPLLIAADSGSLEIVDYLLNRGANVNARHDKGAAPLHPATIKGHLEVIKALLLKGADINARTLDGCTCLIYAVQCGHSEIVEFLLKRGANVNTADKTERWSPLHYAIKHGRDAIFDILLKHKANASISDARGETPLHFSVQHGRLKIATSLLKHGVDIRAKNKSHLTALHCAAKCGRKEIAQLLIENGAEVNCKSNDNLTPLHLAALFGHEDVTDVLIKNKAEINARDIYGATPMYAAAQEGYLNIIEALVKNKAEIDAVSDNGQTPLHIAAMKRHKDVVVFLVENKAKVNRKCNHSLTPLHASVTGGDKHIVEYLLKNKAEINAKGYIVSTPLQGALVPLTPLEIAVQFNNTEVVEILAKNGAQVDVKTFEMTPLFSAINKNNKEMVRVLLSNGANVNADGGQPLLAAIVVSSIDIVDLLLRNNARIDIADPNGTTFLNLATERGDKQMVNALIAKGAKVNASANGLTPLFIAARDGRDEIVQVLIANQADVNFRSVDSTPLHAAAASGRSTIVDILLSNGAKIDARDSQNKTVLESAVGCGHLNVVKVLLRHQNVNKNDRGNDDWTLLHFASLQNNLEMTEFLVNHGYDINARDCYGAKPVHIAAREGYKDIIEFFLSKGLDVDEIGASNETLLQYAAMNDHLEAVKYLISKGANVNVKNSEGHTPMHFAALFGFKDVIVVLLENGAVYNALNNFSLKPLDMTNGENFESVDRNTGQPRKLIKCKDIENLLLFTEKLFEAVKGSDCSQVENCIKSGAFVNAKSANTETTPLHYAAWKGCNQIVNVLLENKANPNAVCGKHSTPLHYAAKFAHFECVKSLLCHGAIYNAVSNSGKTPSDLTTDKNTIDLFKSIDDSFRKVKNGNNQVIRDLDKIKDGDILKAIMNACNLENKTLIAVASRNDFELAKKLKRVSQGDVSAQIEEARQLVVQGSYQRALTIYKRILEKRKQLLGPDNPATLDMQSHIAKALFKQGNYQAALNMLEQVFQKQKQILGFDNKDTLDTRSTIALVLYSQNKYDQALTIYREVYEKQKEILGPNHSDTINTQFHSAVLLQTEGKFEEALDIYTTVYQSKKSILGEFDITTVSAKNNIATVLMNQGKYEEALKMFEDVLEKKKLILGMDHTDTLRTLFNIGALFHRQNRLQEASKTFQQVLDAQKRTMQQNHPDILNTQLQLADVLFNQSKHTAAYKIYKECYDQRIAVFGPNHPSVLIIAKKLEIINLKFNLEGRLESDVSRYLQTDIGLNVACSKGDVQTVKRLLEDGADVNDRDVDGRTPLHYAVNNGRIDIVDILLKNGADVTHATNKGNTPLHTATSKSNNQIVEMLLQRVGGDKLNGFVNAKTASAGTAALHVASKNGCYDVVKSLLKHGAAYDIRNKEGKMPVDLANDQKTISLLKMIDEVFKSGKKGSVGVFLNLRLLEKDEFAIVINARNSQNCGPPGVGTSYFS